MQELERALARRAGRRCAQPQIAVDDADGGELREVVALGHHLRADDDVGLARLDLRDDLAHLGQRRARGRRTAAPARASGKRSATSSAMRSTPGPQATSESGSPHLGHFSGIGSEKPQWWQSSRLAVAVLDQPGRALRAVDAMAAGAAQRQRRVAAAIEEQQRLLPCGQRLGHRLDQHAARATCRCSGGVLAQVDGRDLGQLGAGVAARQDDMAIAAGARVDVALDRRRRGGEHDREACRGCRAPPPCRGA